MPIQAPTHHADDFEDATAWDAMLHDDSEAVLELDFHLVLAFGPVR